jgi:hypothetical protein
MTNLINTIYVSGEWPKDFTEVTMIGLKKKPQATKCSDHRTISLIAHTTKIVAKILRRRLEKKIENVLGEDQFEFRRGKGTRDAIGMLRIISERTLEIDEELSVCFIYWRKAFDRVNWTKLMQILKKIGIDWRERRLISNLNMAQTVKVRMNRGETRSVKVGGGVRQRLLSVTNSVQLVQQIPYQGSFGRVGRLQSRPANHSHCEICRRLCVAG